MKPKLWVKVAGALGVVLVASVVTTVAILSSMDFNRFKADVERLAENATGRELTIEGDLNLAISLSPSLNVSGVTLANAAWGEDKPMMVLKNLQAKVDLVSLLSGQIDVDYIVLDGLALVLQSDGKGRANWEFEAPGAQGAADTKSAGGLSFTPRVRDVRLKNVDLTYIDGATRGRFQVALATVDLQAESFTSPMQAVIEAAYKGVNVEARAELGSLQHLIGTEGGSFPVNMNISAPGMTVTVTGGVEQPSAGMEVEARVSATVTEVPTLAKLAGVDLPQVGRLDARVNVTGAGTTYAFSAIDVKAGSSDFKGNVKLDLAAKRPKLTGKIRSNLVDLNQLAGLEMAKAQGAAYSGPQVAKVAKVPSPGETKPVFSSAPLPILALYKADIDLSLSATKVLLRTLDVAAASTRITLDAGRLLVGDIKLGVEAGKIDGQFVLNGRGKVPSASAKAKVRGLDAGALLVALGQGRLMTLNINGDLDVLTGGSSIQGLMAGMNGQFSFSGRGGRMEYQAIHDLAGGWGWALPGDVLKDGLDISCALGRFPIKDGTMTAETVLADTPDLSVQMTGNVDLGGERLHLTIIPNAKSTSLASFAVPVRLKGSFSAPYIGVDATDAVVGTVANIVKAPVGILVDILGGNSTENGTGGTDDPCLKGLSGGKTPASKPKAAPAPQANPETIQDLGDKLKGLFGQ